MEIILVESKEEVNFLLKSYRTRNSIYNIGEV